MERVCDTFPTNIAAMLREQLRKGVVPSRRTIDRAKLILDVAFMEFMKSVLLLAIRNNDIFILLADESPIHGRKWLMLEWIKISGEKLIEGGRSAMRMKGIPDEVKDRQQRGLQPRPEQIEDSMLLADFVRSTMDRHVMTPVCLSRTKLQHKVCAFVHSWRTETKDFHKLKHILSKQAFQTATDGGTEKKFRKAKINTAQYFWMMVQIRPSDC